MTPLYDLPALQPPPSASEEALDQVLIPQKAILWHPEECHRSRMGKGSGAIPGTLTERWPPRRLATRRERGAAQVAPQSGCEFESRSRKRLEQLATPAHGWPSRGPSLFQLRAPNFGGPRKARSSPALSRKLRPNGAQTAAGGRD